MSDSKSRYKRLKGKKAPINAKKGKEVSEAFKNKRKGNSFFGDGIDYVTKAVANQWESMKPEARQKKMAESGKKNKNKRYDPNSSRDCEKCAGKSGGCQC